VCYVAFVFLMLFYLPCAGILQVEATPPLFAILDRVGM
jgi:hypothetical protein